MWYLQHGRSKGWEDSADANNRKCPPFTMGFCYQKNSVSTADPPKQDIGCPLRDFGITFFHSLSSSLRAWKCGLYFAVRIRANFGGQGRLMYSLPPFSQTVLLYPSILTCGGWKFESLGGGSATQEEVQRLQLGSSRSWEAHFACSGCRR